MLFNFNNKQRVQELKKQTFEVKKPTPTYTYNYVARNFCESLSSRIDDFVGFVGSNFH